jgi:pyruvate-formate lyase
MDKHTKGNVLALQLFTTICSIAEKQDVCFNCFMETILGSAFGTMIANQSEKGVNDLDMAEEISTWLYQEFCDKLADGQMHPSDKSHLH